MPEPPTSETRPRAFSAQGWVLAAGIGLAALGLAGRADPGQAQEQPQETVSYAPGGAVADSNNRMIAVTGVDVTGASVLYLIDTIDYRLAVYQATGGAETTQGIKLIGARRIDLDLKLHGLNDRSQYTYEALRKEFSDKGLLEESGD
jgi:hypothetical protein